MITVVSGLPRSGTSLMMQMFVAGGMPKLSDGERQADTDNPRGYLEWERIKQLPNDPGCIAEAEGKVVKVIASQDQMLRRRGTYKEGADPAVISAAFEKHLREVYAWLDSQTYVKTLRIPYHEELSQPKEIGKQVAEFLQIDLNVDAMNRCVDASLYRNRCE